MSDWSLPDLDDATRAQVDAADPGRSTWLSANAGSGKTRVLTERVARLLLEGVPPERILCLTYTKAAAMEMQNRLFRGLGAWAMEEDDTLRTALAQVGVDAADLGADTLRAARRLFAGAIEAPGGLKIQTIHSFCSSVLRRFPLEAGVAPAFTEIDERVQKRLMADVLDQIAQDPGHAPALDGLVAYLTEDDGPLRVARAVASAADGFEAPWDWNAICGWAGVPPDLTEAGILGRVVTGTEAALCARIWPRLDPTSRTTAKAHRILRDMRWDRMSLRSLVDLESILLSGAGSKTPHVAKIGSFANKGVRADLGDDLEPFEALMRRVEATRPLRVGLMTAQRTRALHDFARAFLPSYEAAKQARGWLDFDDLIRRTLRLLTNPAVAQWVLFRLDGGIDHILVDEAQDTSPEQWQIVAQLATDFAAGAGARADTRRTIFVVGDKKQSIYSFQGADPAGFDRMRDTFSDRLRGIGAPFQSRELVHSFRAAPALLTLVDRVAAGAGGPGVGPDVRHRAFFDQKPGRVDLWPVIPPAKAADPPDWHEPHDLIADEHHVSRFASALVDRIEAMLTQGPAIEVAGKRRPVEPGDILILVQRRSPLFRAIISALKQRQLPMAGVDRAQIDDPLAVKDLVALLSFLATPEDDLSLACVLRSPLGGWTEDDLFRLAHPRPPGMSLWQALRQDAASCPATLSLLRDLRDAAGFLNPYDLLERILIRHDGRRKLLTRLGPEAEDAIDALLAQALAYERIEVPSLTGFLGWLQADAVTVKRDLSQSKGQIRVMTVHGAKGLEAPVVILPDTARRRGGGGHVRLMQDPGAPVVWPRSGVDEIQPIRDALSARATREDEEANRLLYVAMTRAECWLIVGAAGEVGTSEAQSWYLKIRAAMEAEGAVPFALPGEEAPGLRLQTGDWSDPTARPRAATGPGAPAALPAWATRAAPATVRDLPTLSPSDLGGAKALSGEGDGLSEAEATRRGRLVHVLLEHLPHLPPAGWVSAAPEIARLEAHDVTPAELEPLLAEATAVLTHPGLRALFAVDTLPEVTLTADSDTLGRRILGIVDRLVVTPASVMAVDFKTNAIVPESPAQVPEGVLRQMGAYAEVLEAIYPGRQVEVAILWTRAADLMRLPHDLVMAALGRARGS